ncbi:cobyric acid synthase CobQ, partial [Escherichia coli]|nr:cobyric acid synthase CobQ [Escherichia coli]
MLGNLIDDPNGVEGQPGQSEGLGLLDITTTLTNSKQLTNTRAQLSLNGKTANVKGYEIHVVRSEVRGLQPLTFSSGEAEGAIR